MNKKVRIYPRLRGGNIEYVIQQKHVLFWWWWVSACVNSDIGKPCICIFSTFEEAHKNLHNFDNTHKDD